MPCIKDQDMELLDEVPAIEIPMKNLRIKKKVFI